MSGFSIKYPFFIIVACLVVAIVGTRDPHAHAG